MLDASALLSTLYKDERESKHGQIITAIIKNPKNRLFCPSIIRYEFGNNLRTSLKNGRLSFPEAKAFIKVFLKWPLKIFEVDLHTTLHLAIKYNTTYYDASYLSLSYAKNAQLISIDKNLIRAFSSVQNNPS
ncbi:hypothetical protein A3B64_03875 [candidate division WWE3 bacterium RIFCSPLOWO2_01_FULL_37_24]|nr:MAG: hypothetical protein A3B64_03875 [candidate division WWE3 bacterium RIFCSPLOWO2_01_FULL_37_24]